MAHALSPSQAFFLRLSGVVVSLSHRVTQVFTATLTFWGGIYKASNVEQLQT